MLIPKNSKLKLLVAFFTAGTLVWSSSNTGAQEAARVVLTERQKREAAATRAQELFEEAQELISQSRYEEALTNLRNASSMLPPLAPRSAELQSRIYDSIAITLIELAREALVADQLNVARERLEEAFAYAPENPRVLRARSELYAAMGVELDKNNQTIWPEGAAVTPRLTRNIVEVKNLMAEGEAFMSTGQFDEAEKRFQQVLVVDPYNRSARKMLRKVYDNKMRHAYAAKISTREERLMDVNAAWESPIPQEVVASYQGAGVSPIDQSSAQSIERRLSQMIVPRVEFNQASISDVINFLNIRSKELDTAAEKKGFNFVSRIGPDTPTNDITMSVRDMPMLEVLRYACQLANVKFQIGEFAITIVPLTAETNQLITKEYLVRPDFLARPSQVTTQQTPRRTRQVQLDKNVTTASVINVKQALEDRGVRFDAEGSSVVYSQATGRLTVRNTPQQIEIIDMLIGSDLEVVPQVMIETKFVEINQSDLDELSTAMNIVKDGNYTYARSDTSPNNMDGFNNLDGLRTSSDLSPRSIDALLDKNRGIDSTPQSNKANFGIYAVGYNFDVMIRALSQKNGYDVLAAPKVIARSGERASIRIVRRFMYPIEYEKPEFPTSLDTTTTSGGGGGGLTTALATPVVAPAFPAEFAEKEVGVVLDVRPQVGPDNYSISMDLMPEITDFEGFINYGEPILNPLNPNPRTPLTENVINMPVFNTRTIRTSVQVFDGQTLVLGGLLREDTQKIEDKVPIVGDIPLLGRLFRSKVLKSLKKNLMIFVSPRLITPTGEFLNPVERISSEQLKMLN
jgi:general secretion pathway protein D